MPRSALHRPRLANVASLPPLQWGQVTGIVAADGGGVVVYLPPLVTMQVQGGPAAPAPVTIMLGPLTFSMPTGVESPASNVSFTLPPLTVTTPTGASLEAAPISMLLPPLTHAPIVGPGAQIVPPLITLPPLTMIVVGPAETEPSTILGAIELETLMPTTIELDLRETR